MKIEVTQKDGLSRAHVVVDGVQVGSGPRDGCEALARELRDDETGKKARMLYDWFKENKEAGSGIVTLHRNREAALWTSGPGPDMEKKT